MLTLKAKTYPDEISKRATVGSKKFAPTIFALLTTLKTDFTSKINLGT